MWQVLMIGSFGKICQHHWKKYLNIRKLAKFESNTSLVSEGGSFGEGQVSPLNMYKLQYNFATLPGYIFVRINKSILH